MSLSYTNYIPPSRCTKSKSFGESPNGAFHCLWKETVLQSVCPALTLEPLNQTVLFVGAFVPIYLVMQVFCNTSTLRMQLLPLDLRILELLLRCGPLRVLIFSKMSPDVFLMCRNSSVGRALDWRSKGPWFDPGFRQLVFDVFDTHFLGRTAEPR